LAQRKLTKRQKERIRHIQDKRRRHLSGQKEHSSEQDGDLDPSEGRVVTRHGRNLLVADRDGELFLCQFRQNIGHAVCGDRVVWHPTGAQAGVVTALLERESVLARPDYSGREKPLAANISQLVVVIAPQPEPSEYLLDQYLVTAETIGISAMITLNKSDQLSTSDAELWKRRFEVYKNIGYPVIWVSAREEHGLDPLVECLKQQTSILVGQSGVGKSSLVKALLPNQEIQIGRLSDATGLGRHTTSTTTCYDLPQGGYLIDSPGVRSFRLVKLTRDQLERGFREFEPFLGHCQFRDCRHEQEPGCGLKEAVEKGLVDRRRWENFLHLAENLSTEAGENRQ
jgi:ribosome biogenesis GTPase